MCCSKISCFCCFYSSISIVCVGIINATCLNVCYLFCKDTDIAIYLIRLEKVYVSLLCRNLRNSPACLCYLDTISTNSLVGFFSNKSNIRSVRVSTHALLYSCYITLCRNHTRHIYCFLDSCSTCYLKDISFRECSIHLFCTSRCSLCGFDGFVSIIGSGISSVDGCSKGIEVYLIKFALVGR